MEAKAQMKYHHLERCFTYRMKRPMVLRSLRAARRLGLGLWVLRTFTSGFAIVRLRACLVRTQPWRPCAPIRSPSGGRRVLFRDICQMGSLAGAAYLLHNNAGVLRQAQWEQKSHVEHKRIGLLD